MTVSMTLAKKAVSRVVTATVQKLQLYSGERNCHYKEFKKEKRKAKHHQLQKKISSLSLIPNKA